MPADLAAHPLASIKFCRIELLGILSSVTPFTVSERIHAEVDERGNLVALPGDLSGRRPDVDGLGKHRVQRVVGR